jgi:hypothetical protein
MCAHARTQLQKQNKFPSLHIVISRFSPPASAHCSPNPAHLNYPFAVWSDQSLFAKPETTAFVTYAFQLARRGLYVPPLDNTTPRCYYIARLKGIYGRGRASLVSSSPFFLCVSLIVILASQGHENKNAEIMRGKASYEGQGKMNERAMLLVTLRGDMHGLCLRV